ncbi:MAG TPA: carboxypeptidase-like regulatory domain-containing protein [Longimicrobiales bacterium]
MSRTRALLAAALLAFGASGAAAAVQNPELRGRVVDGDGRPVAGVEVALHRVTPAGGATVARATTGDDGSFVLPITGSGDGDDAIYFAATRLDGRLYIGAFFRGDPPTGPYEIFASGPGVQGAGQAPSGLAFSGAGQAGPARWPLVTGVALLLALGCGLTILSATGDARRTRRQRTLLLEIASLDEALARRGGAADPDEHERYLRRRARLQDRLRAAAQRAP